MASFKEISPLDYQASPFGKIGKEWMLITAEKEGRVNMMTASWGGMGVMWNKNVAFMVIRPQRFTKDFVDNADTFSLVFLGEESRETLTYLGTVSGRDENKVEKTGLTVAHDGETPYFEEASAVFVCKKLYAQPYTEDSFIDEECNTRNYPDKDYHTLYIGEITKILVKE